MPKYIPADGPSKPVETAEQSTSPNKAGKQKHVGHALPAGQVMRGAEALGGYINLPQQEAFDIEYWQLEEAKLKRMPAEQELARQVIAVVGAGSGIGKETAHRLAKEGALIVCVDLNEKRWG